MSRVKKRFLKAQPGWVFSDLLGFGFYWHFGCAVPAAVINMEKENY